MRDPKLEKAAAAHYDAKMPYHNFRHALEAAEAGQQVVARCRKAGVAIDEKVVYYALLFHDAGYHEDHTKHGFSTKEEYSAAIAERALASNGADPALIESVKAAILGTERDAAPSTNELKAVRAADLAQLAASYPVFKRNTINLKREFELMQGTHITWADWKKKAIAEVEFYLSQNLYMTIGKDALPEAQEFHKRARENLRLFKADADEKIP